MDLYSAIILGLVQGLTEFLPISSSGHLVVAREMFGLSYAHGLAYDGVLHIATAASVIVYFRREWVQVLGSMKGSLLDRASVALPDRILLAGLVVGTIPVVVIGLLFGDAIEALLYDTRAVAFIFLLSAVLFAGAEWFARARQTGALSISRAGVIGLFQMCALAPGLSRSGATIAGGLFVGLSRVEAARFSFMLSLPVILGVGLLKLVKLGSTGALLADLIPIVAGSFVACVSGILTIHYFIRYLKKYTLIPFAAYLVLVAIVMLWW
jgi:undecaprenyl-diphosphatase